MSPVRQLLMWFGHLRAAAIPDHSSVCPDDGLPSRLTRQYDKQTAAAAAAATAVATADLTIRPVEVCDEDIPFADSRSAENFAIRWCGRRSRKREKTREARTQTPVWNSTFASETLYAMFKPLLLTQFILHQMQYNTVIVQYRCAYTCRVKG